MKASRRSKNIPVQGDLPKLAEGIILQPENLPPELSVAGSQATILSGSLDQYASEALRITALRLLDSEGDAVFDFSDVDRMHAASLQVLVALHKDLQPTGRRVVLKSVAPTVRRLFCISGTEELFQFSDGSR